MSMDYDRIAELAEREHVEDANKLLKKGWVFVKAAETLKLDQSGHQFTAITYILGKQKPDKKLPKRRNEDAEKQQNTAPDVKIPDILSLNIQWRQKKDQNPNFYYAFVNALDGKPDPVVEPVVKAISANGGVIVQGEWRFTVKNRFLQRARHESSSCGV